jgi:hypothetical protein
MKLNRLKDIGVSQERRKHFRKLYFQFPDTKRQQFDKQVARAKSSDDIGMIIGLMRTALNAQADDVQEDDYEQQVVTSSRVLGDAPEEPKPTIRRPWTCLEYVKQFPGVELYGCTYPRKGQPQGNFKHNKCKCGVRKLSMYPRWNGSGGFKCYGCGWHHAEGDIIGFKRAADLYGEERPEPEQPIKLPNYKAVAQLLASKVGRKQHHYIMKAIWHVLRHSHSTNWGPVWMSAKDWLKEQGLSEWEVRTLNKVGREQLNDWLYFEPGRFKTTNYIPNPALLWQALEGVEEQPVHRREARGRQRVQEN